MRLPFVWKEWRKEGCWIELLREMEAGGEVDGWDAGLGCLGFGDLTVERSDCSAVWWFDNYLEGLALWCQGST